MIKLDVKNRFTGEMQLTAEIDCLVGATTYVKMGLAVKWANLIHCGTRSDGYEFYAHIRDGKIWIKAGCRYFTIKDASAHWKQTRPTDNLGKESHQLLKNARALIKIRGLK